MWTEAINHDPAITFFQTGSQIAGRPSLGSWVSYGLGSFNQNLPAFVVIEDNKGQVVNGPRNWGAGFMPAVYQGVPLQSAGEPIRYLQTPKGVSGEEQQALPERERKNSSATCLFMFGFLSCSFPPLFLSSLTRCV